MSTTTSGKILVSLRPARIEDSTIIFRWNNDPLSREMSTYMEPIDWEEHCQWLSLRLQPSYPESLWIAEDATGSPVATGRLLSAPKNLGVISIVVAPKSRRQGIGKSVIRLLADKVNNMGRTPTAIIKSKNKASIHAFTANGFALFRRKINDPNLMEFRA